MERGKPEIEKLKSTQFADLRQNAIPVCLAKNETIYFLFIQSSVLRINSFRHLHRRMKHVLAAPCRLSARTGCGLRHCTSYLGIRDGASGRTCPGPIGNQRTRPGTGSNNTLLGRRAFCSSVAHKSEPEPVSSTAEPRHRLEDHGITFNTIRGSVAVNDEATARQPHPTILLLTSMVDGLRPSDFYAIARSRDGRQSGREVLLKGNLCMVEYRTSAHGFTAIVARDESLSKLPYWILLFRSPFDAAVYQQRLRWNVQNTKQNLPVNPVEYFIGPNRHVVPPEGYRDALTGEDVWQRLREFSIVASDEELRLNVLTSPFPPVINRMLELHEDWIAGEGEDVCWPVKFSAGDMLVSRQAINSLLRSSVETPGMKTRSRPWDLRFVSGTNQESIPLTPEGRHWIIKFPSESNALRFWRAWHHQTLPALLGQGRTALIAIDPLW